MFLLAVLETLKPDLSDRFADLWALFIALEGVGEGTGDRSGTTGYGGPEGDGGGEGFRSL